MKPQSKLVTPQIIVALDVDTLEEAERFVNILYPTVSIFKVGSQLFTVAGPKAVEMIKQKGARVFLDLKFHDIPNTVYQSVSAGTASAVMITSAATMGVNKDVKHATELAVFMMTVHIKGGKEMLEAAVKGAIDKSMKLNIKKPFIVGVTRLTSDRNEKDVEKNVLQAAQLAKDAGLDGVVCSVYEAPMIREKFGNNFKIVTPGIRPKDYPSDDQLRVATAGEAIEAGVDFIVIGRPVIKAEKPLKVMQDIAKEISHIA